MPWNNIWSRMWRGLGLPVAVRYGYLPHLRPPGGEPQQEPVSLPSVFGAISTLADAVTSLDWGIAQTTPDGSSSHPVPNHPAARSLQSWPLSERWAWCWSALYAGNGVALVHDDLSLETFPAERVTLQLWDDGTLKYGLIPVAGGDSLEVDSSQCAVLKYRPIGRDARVGISPLVACNPAVVLLLQQRRTVNSVLRNAALPSGILSTDRRIDPARAEQMAERWNRARGVDDGGLAGNTAILEEGLKYETVRLNDLQELAAVESANLGVAEIARLYSVPPSILSGDVSNRATAVEDRRRLLSFSVSPLARLAEAALAEVLLTPGERRSGLRVLIDDTVVLLGQGSELGAVAASLLNSGALSPNEVRALLAFPPVPDGDLLRAPSNTYALPAWADWEPKSNTENTGDDARAFPVSRRRISAQARLLKLHDDILGVSS